MKSSANDRPDITHTLGLETSRVRKWGGAMLLTGAALALAYFGTGFYIGRQERGSAVRYETMRMARGDLTVTVSATGTLEPVNEVEVGSEISGTLKSVAVDYNDNVKQGQVLARIDTTKLEAQVLQSEAALEAAHAKVLDAEATLKEAEAQLSRLKRVHELSGGKVPSQYELESQEASAARARAGVASANADVSQAQATLNVNRTDLGKAVIYSPINGVVLTRKIEPGQTVAASFEAPVLFTLAEDLTQLELQVDVDEADVGQVREGQVATFTVDAYPDKHFPAAITQVRYGSQTTDGVVTYTAVLKVNNDDLSLRPGMTATSVITTKKVEKAWLVPNAALRFDPSELQRQAAKGSGSSLIASLLPHPPRREVKQTAAVTPSGQGQHIYVMRGGQPAMVPVNAGITDGSRTEVSGDGLSLDMEVVTDAESGRQS